MEAHDAILPLVVQNVELCILIFNNCPVELIAFFVLSCVLFILIGDLLLHELVDLWLKIESNIDELLPHAAEVRSASFLLEGLEIIEAVSQILHFLLALGPLRCDLLPNTVDVADFISKQQLIRQASHEVLDFNIRSLQDGIHSLFDLGFLL